MIRRERLRTMKLAKKFKDIKFHDYGDIEISEPIAMASAAGWYVGSLCIEDGITMPYDRMTDYVATKEIAESMVSAWSDE